MVKRYKVKEIYNRIDNTPVTKQKYKWIVGYDCYFDKVNIYPGESFLFWLIDNPEHFWWITSIVVKFEEPDSKTIKLTTRNSIYIFKELGDYIESKAEEFMICL